MADEKTTSDEGQLQQTSESSESTLSGNPEKTPELSKGSEGWLEATAKDERGTNRHRESAPSQRSRQSRQASYWARQDWQRTVHGARMQVFRQVTPRHPHGQYAKGWVDN